MVKIGDIMKSQVVTVEKGTPVMEAVQILVENNFTGLPVVDTKDRVIGIISEKDVLSLAIRVQEQSYSPEQEELRVEDFMTKKAVTIEATESLTALCSCLMKNQFRRVPVVLNNKLVGVASRRDVISDIFHLKCCT